ncbi:MAG: DsbA family protein, partial [Persicimonas sp.]
MAKNANDNMTIRLLSYVFVALIAFAGGFLVGGWSLDGDEDSDSGAAKAPSDSDDAAKADDSAIPVGDSPTLGDDDALITVVEFSDFQCPFCEKGANTVKQLEEKYPDEVRVVFKHNPLPMHKQAPDAHKASIAAHNQGKFWEMHDFLFENQKQIKQNGDDIKGWTAKEAEKMGLDVEQFKKDFDSEETQKKIDADMELSKKVEVKGTPHFFVNGERVKGAKPVGEFEKIIDSQLKEAEKMIDQGSASRGEVYDKMVEKNFDGDGGGGQKAEKPDKPKQPKQAVEYVPVEDEDPGFGNQDDPLVTIVEFSDFQCPFCSKVVPTVDKIKEKYGDDVRFSFKQLPMQMHKQAKPAAKASLAADRQDKFWEMHDLLFEKQKEMKKNGDNFKEWSAGLAEELGMNVDKFKEDYDDPEIEKKVEKDFDLAKEVGARGTPNFWINGVNVRGAQPYQKFESTIDEQIKKAKKLKKEDNLSGDELYKELVELNKKDAPKPSAEKPKKPEKPKQPKADGDVDDLTLDDVPT